MQLVFTSLCQWLNWICHCFSVWPHEQQLWPIFAGNPPQCNAWVGQCGLYILVMIIEKLLMTLLVLFHFWRDVSDISDAFDSQAVRSFDTIRKLRTFPAVSNFHTDRNRQLSCQSISFVRMISSTKFWPVVVEFEMIDSIKSFLSQFYFSSLVHKLCVGRHRPVFGPVLKWNGSLPKPSPRTVFFQVRRFIMSPIRDPHLELVIVIFIVPFVVNVSVSFR